MAIDESVSPDCTMCVPSVALPLADAASTGAAASRCVAKACRAPPVAFLVPWDSAALPSKSCVLPPPPHASFGLMYNFGSGPPAAGVPNATTSCFTVVLTTSRSLTGVALTAVPAGVGAGVGAGFSVLPSTNAFFQGSFALLPPGCSLPAARGVCNAGGVLFPGAACPEPSLPPALALSSPAAALDDDSPPGWATSMMFPPPAPPVAG